MTSEYAYVGPGRTGASHSDLPVINAATAVMSYRKFLGVYQPSWPERKARQVRARILELAAALPAAERDRLPDWWPQS